jgi:hypothetical protein
MPTRSGSVIDVARPSWTPARVASTKPSVRPAGLRGGPGPRSGSALHEVGDFSILPPPERTRAPEGASGEDDVTVSDAGVPDAGPAPASPAPAGPALRCEVASGPTYTPSGNIPPTRSGGVNKFPFSFASTFTNRSPAAVLPACCSVRQYIKWDQRYVDSKGGPPHSGFPAATPVDTWIEDRDDRDKRYGHRSGVHSDPIAGGGDEYTTRGVRDQAAGDTYNGRDAPQAPVSRRGTWNFQLNVIDTCTGEAVKASSSVITVRFG